MEVCVDGSGTAVSLNPAGIVGHTWCHCLQVHLAGAIAIRLRTQTGMKRPAARNIITFFIVLVHGIHAIINIKREFKTVK